MQDQGAGVGHVADARPSGVVQAAPAYLPSVHPTRNHFLPPDPDAFKRERPSHGRVIVIAPTRAACETIELALGLTGVDTVLEREHGAELREWALGGQGFGIVAGTGTGKTLGIRPVAESMPWRGW